MVRMESADLEGRGDTGRMDRMDRTTGGHARRSTHGSAARWSVRDQVIDQITPCGFPALQCYPPFPGSVQAPHKTRDRIVADRIRVGIVGATVTPGGSGWGANAHVPALQALPNYELKAVCTAHAETAKASAEKFGADLAFHDINQMAAHPEVDLVTVVVRVPWHKELVLAAIGAGKPVCCE